jgi:hypothetical protein
MNLTKKLLIGFGAMVALVLLMSVGALMEVRDLNVDLDRAANVNRAQAISRRRSECGGVIHGQF